MIGDGWHQVVGPMGFELRRAGHKPFIADLMIAFTAINNKVPLLSSDTDFIPYAELFKLMLE